MKVSELIAKLKYQNQDAEVIIGSADNANHVVFVQKCFADVCNNHISEEKPWPDEMPYGGVEEKILIGY